MVMDGAGHIFAISGSTVPGIIDEFAVSGTSVNQVFPASGYTGWSSGESPTINPDASVPSIYPSSASAISSNGVMAAAIDGSGNLWVLNIDTGTMSSPGNVLVEYIGIAAPVVTPNSLALKYDQVAVRP